MPKYKTIRIAKVNGGSRLQRVMVLANGKYRFVKNTKTRGISKRKPKKSTRKYQVRKTARRAYVGLKRKVKKKRNTNKAGSAWNF
tara:strand:- start:1231 stop:1485 length:255 start_codon:yes stop_codon:yes gene_type:complete